MFLTLHFTPVRYLNDSGFIFFDVFHLRYKFKNKHVKYKTFLANILSSLRKGILFKKLYFFAYRLVIGIGCGWAKLNVAQKGWFFVGASILVGCMVALSVTVSTHAAANFG